MITRCTPEKSKKCHTVTDQHCKEVGRKKCRTVQERKCKKVKVMRAVKKFNKIVDYIMFRGKTVTLQRSLSVRLSMLSPAMTRRMDTKDSPGSVREFLLSIVIK